MGGGEGRSPEDRLAALEKSLDMVAGLIEATVKSHKELAEACLLLNRRLMKLEARLSAYG